MLTGLFLLSRGVKKIHGGWEKKLSNKNCTQENNKPKER
jgi:hypothetical protein